MQRNSIGFIFTSIVALAGLCLGIADIALAGPNTQGCRTILWEPAQGPVGILCVNVSCPDKQCTIRTIGGNQWLCGCPSVPGSALVDFVDASTVCPTIIWYNGEEYVVSCPSINCAGTCDVVEREIHEGSQYMGKESECDCV